MTEKQSSKLNYLKIEQKQIKEYQKRYLASFLTAIQGIFLSLILSSINLNTLFSWYDNNHFKRVILILVSVQISVLWKLLSRMGTITPKQLVFTIFISHLIFCYSFIYTKTMPKISRKLIFPFSKISVHVNIIFSLAYSFSFSLYHTFIDFYIKNIPRYTQSRGLLSFIKSNLPEALIDSKKTLMSCIKISLGFLVCYLCLIHTILNFILFFFRIEIFYKSIKEILLHTLILIINNIIFTMMSKMVDIFVIFNISYRPNDLILEGIHTKTLDYQKAVVSYKNKEIKFKNSPKLAQTIESSIIEDIHTLNSILEDIDRSKKDLDSKTFVTVPQANKGYTRKYKAYNLIDFLESKICYIFQIFVFSRRFRYTVENLVEKLHFVIFVKEQESIVITSVETQSLLDETVNKSREIADKLNINIVDEKLTSIYNKIH